MDSRSGNSDRVLVTQPSNWAEAIVTGVIDGFCKRPEVQQSGPSLALLPDEQLRVTDASGAPLVDVVPSDEGPVVRILRVDVNIEVEGKLRLAARQIDIVSREGDATVKARENVVILGRTIQLNQRPRRRWPGKGLEDPQPLRDADSNLAHPGSTEALQRPPTALRAVGRIVPGSSQPGRFRSRTSPY